MNSNPARDKGLVFNPDFDKQGGLLPVVVQDSRSLEVLMLGWANKEALDTALREGRAAFWSRSRSKLWIKGESSGHYLRLDEVRVDCDQDSLLYLVSPADGGVCHTKARDARPRRTCFYRSLETSKSGVALRFAAAELE